MPSSWVSYSVAGVVLLRLLFTKNKKVIITSLFLGCIICTNTVLKQVENETHLDKGQSIFTVAVKQTSVKVDGDFLRFTGLVINEKSRSEEVVVTYQISSEAEKLHIEKNGIPNFIKIQGSLKVPNEAKNFHQFSYRDYLNTKQIYWTLKAEKLINQEDPPEKRLPVQYKMDSVRARLFKKIDHSIGKSTATYLKALMFADKRELSESTIENFRSLGIVHLLSISGLHIQFIIMLVERSLLKAGLSKERTGILMVVVLPIYGVFAGWSVSVFRAVVQAELAYIQMTAGVKSHSLDNWSATMIFALMIDPFQIFSSGFQLSYLLSCLMIVISSQNWFKVLDAFKAAVALNVVVFLISLPILTYHFYGFSWVILFLNFLFVPLFSFIILPLLAFVGLLSITFSVFPVLSNITNLSDSFLQIVEEMVNKVSGLQSFTIVTGRLSIFAMLLLCVGILLLLVCFEIEKKSISVSLWVIGLLFCSIALFSERYSPVGKVVMLDVGQGDAFLIKQPWGEGNYLIDTGGLSSWQEKEEWTIPESPYSIGRDVVIPSLKSLGVGKVDQIILTHADSDHSGALKSIIEHLPVTSILSTRETLIDPLIQQSYPSILEKDIQLVPSTNSNNYEVIPGLQVIYPFDIKQSSKESSKNNESLVLYGKVGQYRWLFTGDLEAAGEMALLNRYPRLKADILKIAHHGSKTSSREEFIKAVAPNVGWISSGENNFYGHPNLEVIDRLENQHIIVYRTDKQGAVSYSYFTFPFTDRVDDKIETVIED